MNDIIHQNQDILSTCKATIVASADGVMLWAETWRTETLTWVMKALSALGTEEFFLAFLMVGLWFGNQQKYYKAGLLLLTSTMINAHLKGVFAECRPVVVTHLELAGGYSFPSGHAQSAGTMFGYFAVLANRLWVRSLLVLTMLGVAASRVYLGVHFFHDVLSGLLVGFVIVAVVCLLPWQILALPIPQSLVRLGVILGFAGWAALIDDPEGNIWKLAGALGGFIAGGAFIAADEQIFDAQNRYGWTLLRIMLGMAGVWLLWKGLKPIMAATGLPVSMMGYSRYFLLALWLIVVPRLGPRAR